jgi:hypothetical protein
MVRRDRYSFAAARSHSIRETAALNSASRVLLFEEASISPKGVRMSAAKILWGQIAIVVAIVLVAVWAATQWTACRGIG